MSTTNNFGYSGIYDEIVSDRVPAKKFEGLVYNLLFLPVLILSAATGVASINQRLDIVTAISWLIIIFLIFSFLIIGSGWLFGFFVFAFPGPPPVQWVVARILIEVRSPFEDRFGLNYQEIDHLKAIAQIDQASADWKNGYLTIGILSLLLAVIQGLSTDIEQFLDKVLFIGPPDTGIVSQYYGAIILWGLAITIIVLVTLSVFRPLGEFLAKEPVNHVILDACEEAKGLLVAYKFTSRKSLKLKEKLKIAEKCGCNVIEDIKVNRHWYFRIHQFKDESGKTWLLQPPRLNIYMFDKLRQTSKTWFMKLKGRLKKLKQRSPKGR